MADQGSLNQLLQWGIENSGDQQGQPNQPTRDATKGLDSKVLAQLLGAPSDADLMREAMRVITAPLSESPLDAKLTAWDNMEQLVEQIDNANNLEPLGLWQPLIDQLSNEDPECRAYAAWCISTAVQNNIKCQERLLAAGGVEKLLSLVLNDPSKPVRKKAATALSSEVRNYQPALDDLMEKIPQEFVTKGRKLDACGMEEVNSVIDALRQRADQS